ncbi:MAG TPA: glycosyltransferase family 39 protein [Candidatus Polarisedimenticolia bacterium]
MSDEAVHGSLGRWGRPLLVAVLLVGALLRLGAIQHHRSLDYDEGRYLDNAANIMKGRGLATHYTSHFFREAPPLHAEDISSPLYPYLLAGTFQLTGVEPRAAQLWSLFAGCLMIALTFVLGRRLFDERTALLASILVALNPDSVIMSSWSMTEMLYGAMVLGILLLADGNGIASLSLTRAAALGGACGLLYLTRANGLSVAAAMGLVALVQRRPAAAAGLVLAFLAVVSPWLARNQRVFGSPTWSAMKHVAWSQSGRDLFTRGGEPPSAARFLREHGSAALVKNVVHRGWRAARHLVWGDTGAYNFLCALYPFALLAHWRQRRLLPGHLCILMTTLLLAGVPTWTGALSRYLTPVRPFMYLCVIGAAMHIVPEMIWRRNLRRASGPPRPAGPPPAYAMTTEPVRRQTAMALATLVAVIALVSTHPLRAYLATDDMARDVLGNEAARWIAAETPADAVLMEGAWIHQYAYLFDRPVVWVPAGSLDDVRDAASDYGARYLVISRDLLRFHPELRPHFEETEEGIRGVDLPEGFREVFAGAGRRVVIWEIREVNA